MAWTEWPSAASYASWARSSSVAAKNAETNSVTRAPDGDEGSVIGFAVQ